MERNSRGQKESVRPQEEVGLTKVKEEADREKEAGLQEKVCGEGHACGKAFRQESTCQENARQESICQESICQENARQKIASDGRSQADFEKRRGRSPTARAASPT